MVAVGVLYLTFDKSILGQSSPRGDSSTLPNNSLSRTLIGIQVNCLTAYVALQDLTDRK
jgi:hypothetical protein